MSDADTGKKLIQESGGARSESELEQPIIANSRSEDMPLRRAWTELSKRSLAPDCDPDRFLAVTSAVKAVPYVGSFHGKHTLPSLLVGRVVQRRVTCRMGYYAICTPMLRCLEIPHGGLMFETDCAPAAIAMVRHLLWLLRSRQVDHIMLNHLPVDGLIYPLLKQRFCTGRRAFGTLMARRIEPHWQTRLHPGSLENSLAHHSAKHRSNLRRMDRRLAEHFGGEVRLEVYSSIEQVPEYLEKVHSISKHTYQFALDAAVTDSDQWRAQLKAEAQHGRLRSYLLVCRDEPIAFQNCVVYGDRCFLEGTGYLPKYAELRPGTVMFIRVLADLCQHGIATVDYGFGDAEYKRVYGTDCWQEATVHLYGIGPRARLSWAVDLATSRGSEWATRALGPRVQSVKKAWRFALARGKGEGKAMATLPEILRRWTGLKRLVFAARGVRTRIIERYYGINTIAEPGGTGSGHFSDSCRYEAIAYPLLRRYLDTIDLSPDDVVYDVGCGAGRVLCLFARRQIRKAVGVEFSPALAAAARANGANLRGRKAEVAVIEGDAAFADYSEGTVFCFFNPFGAKTLRAVVSRIRESVQAHPRRIRIVYINPFHESVLQESGWLRHTGRQSAYFFKTNASYWESIPDDTPSVRDRGAAEALHEAPVGTAR